MIKGIPSKAAWTGLAVALAVVVGAASMAFAANGKPFSISACQQNKKLAETLIG